MITLQHTYIHTYVHTYIHTYIHKPNRWPTPAMAEVEVWPKDDDLYRHTSRAPRPTCLRQRNYGGRTDWLASKAELNMGKNMENHGTTMKKYLFSRYSMGFSIFFPCKYYTVCTPLMQFNEICLYLHYRKHESNVKRAIRVITTRSM